MNNLLLIFIGGGLGSLARYGISALMKPVVKTTFPLSTLCSNVLSCVILAITIVVFSSRLPGNSGLKMFIITGFCGGFSTFSTFSYETVELIKNNNWGYAIANILISVITCIMVIYIAIKTNHQG